MQGSSFQISLCHALPPNPGDIWVTNDLHGETDGKNQASDLHFLVELRGFEPLTPSMRTRCATGLRYSPWDGCQRSKDLNVFALQSPTARPASEYWS